MWAWILAVILASLAAAFVGSFVGALAGIDWHERSRMRDLKRKRADITAALDRDTR